MNLSGYISTTVGGKERLIFQDDPGVEIIRVSQKDLETLVDFWMNTQTKFTGVAVLWFGWMSLMLAGMLVMMFGVLQWVPAIAMYFPWLKSFGDQAIIGVVVSAWGTIFFGGFYILRVWTSRLWKRYHQKIYEILSPYGSYPAEKVWLEDDIYKKRNGYVVLSSEKKIPAAA